MCKYCIVGLFCAVKFFFFFLIFNFFILRFVPDKILTNELCANGSLLIVCVHPIQVTTGGVGMILLEDNSLNVTLVLTMVESSLCSPLLRMDNKPTTTCSHPAHGRVFQMCSEQKLFVL